MIALNPCIPAKAGTQVLTTRPPSVYAPRTPAALAAAQAWVPAFAGMHGVG